MSPLAKRFLQGVSVGALTLLLLFLAGGVYFYYQGREILTDKFAKILKEEERKLNFDCRGVRQYALKTANAQLKPLVEDIPARRRLRDAITAELQKEVGRLNDLVLKCEALYNIAVQADAKGREEMRIPDNAKMAISKINAIVVSGVGEKCDKVCEQGLHRILADSSRTIMRELSAN